MLSAETIEILAWALGSYLIVGTLVSILLTMGVDFTRKHAPERLSEDGREFVKTTPKREIFSFVCVAWPTILVGMAFAFLQRIRKGP